MPETFDAAFDTALQEVQGAEQSVKADPAPEPDKPAEPSGDTAPVEAKGAEPAQPQESSEQLLDQGKWNELKDPEAKLKALNQAWTQKTQALSAQQKQLEPLIQLAKGLSESPQKTIQELARSLNVELSPSASPEKAAAVAAETTANLLDSLRESLGPEYDFLADKIAPAIEQAIRNKTADIIGREIEPIRQQARQREEEAVVQRVDLNIEAFSKKHPDWKQYEAQMSDIGKRLVPQHDPQTGQPASWESYMEDLYFLATKDVREADIAKRTIERMQKSADKSDAPDSGVSNNRVGKTAPARKGSFDADFEEAANDARAGIIYQ
jgi:hypothetical protein